MGRALVFALLLSATGCETDVVLAVRDAGGDTIPSADASLTEQDSGSDALPPGWEDWECTTCEIDTCPADWIGKCELEAGDCIWDCESR